MKSKYPFTNDSSLRWTSGAELPVSCLYGARLVLPEGINPPVRFASLAINRATSLFTATITLIDADNAVAGYIIFTDDPANNWMNIYDTTLRTGYCIDKTNDYGGAVRGSSDFVDILKASNSDTFDDDAFILTNECVYCKADTGFLGYTKNIVISDTAVVHTGSIMSINTAGKSTSMKAPTPIKAINGQTASGTYELAIVHKTTSGLKCITKQDSIWIGRAADNATV